MTTGRVGVVGASARAAVMSLARAGYSAWAVDLFADRDLQRIAECARCPLADYPEAIPTLAERFPPGPFLFTGGLENAPEVVAALASKRPLWGSGPDALRLVRDPFFVAKLLVDSPRLQCEQSLVPSDGRWLVKSLGSSGGLGVRSARAGERVPSGCYLQEFVAGPAISAVFNGPQLLGITEQLTGPEWLHSNAFHYAGTIGPINLPSGGIQKLVDAAQRLGAECGVQGIFGIDFIWNRDQPWIVEINPRYPA
ncbi:MAG TPA: ATP-grasp domain-containing protein, partial [Urbifossiella sp.]|nr:ATP-grasp domain-containing protein [Urbifossiella sp.]